MLCIQSLLDCISYWTLNESVVVIIEGIVRQMHIADAFYAFRRCFMLCNIISVKFYMIFKFYAYIMDIIIDKITLNVDINQIRTANLKFN